MNFLYCFGGVLVGTLIGVLPGIGPVATMSMLFPFTMDASPLASIIMLAGVYYGAMYGGSTTSILVNIPGEAASVVTCLDGYQMARQGKAGRALGISAFGSFIAGTLGLIGLTLVAPPMVTFALKFGPPEYFALMILGLTILSFLSKASMVKCFMMVGLGLILSYVGLDVIAGQPRFTFDIDEFFSGINIIAVVVGLFGVAEILENLERPSGSASVFKTGLKQVFPNLKDWSDSIWAIARGSLIGFFLGVLPGGGALLGSFVAYAIEKRVSKHPEKFGSGVIEGVAAPEGANNATCSGGFVPLFAFGLPTGPALAVLLGGLMMYGLQPGPMLFTQNPKFVWTVIASMYIGNVILLILNLPLVGWWARIALIPFPALGPLIILFSVIGAYSLRFLLFDVWVALLFGVIGYVMRKLGFPVAPMVLATVLAQMLETSLQQALLLSQGSPLIFFTRPLSAVFMTLAIASIVRGIWLQAKAHAPEVALEEAEV